MSLSVCREVSLTGWTCRCAVSEAGDSLLDSDEEREPSLPSTQLLSGVPASQEAPNTPVDSPGSSHTPPTASVCPSHSPPTPLLPPTASVCPPDDLLSRCRDSCGRSKVICLDGPKSEPRLCDLRSHPHTLTPSQSSVVCLRPYQMCPYQSEDSH